MIIYFDYSPGDASRHNQRVKVKCFSHIFQQSHLQVFGQKLCMYGHSAAITSLYVSTAYSVLVSGSRDNTIIIWDLNKYVLSLYLANQSSQLY